VEGTTNAGNYIRRSLKLTSWERGEEKKRELEAGPGATTNHVEPAAVAQPITIREATEKFCKECEARSLGDATMRKYRALVKQIREFASTRFVYSIPWLWRSCALENWLVQKSLPEKQSAPCAIDGSALSPEFPAHANCSGGFRGRPFSEPLLWASAALFSTTSPNYSASVDHPYRNG
jgi:hypothetical protein